MIIYTNKHFIEHTQKLQLYEFMVRFGILVRLKKMLHYNAGLDYLLHKTAWLYPKYIVDKFIIIIYILFGII